MVISFCYYIDLLWIKLWPLFPMNELRGALYFDIMENEVNSSDLIVFRNWIKALGEILLIAINLILFEV